MSAAFAPPRPAPHVARAIAAAQAKTADPADPRLVANRPRPPAAHLAAALQAKPAAAAAPPAAHVAAAIAARPAAAATNPVAQAKAAAPAGRPIAPHVRAAVAVAQAKKLAPAPAAPPPRLSIGALPAPGGALQAKLAAPSSALGEVLQPAHRLRKKVASSKTKTSTQNKVKYKAKTRRISSSSSDSDDSSSEVKKKKKAPPKDRKRKRVSSSSSSSGTRQKVVKKRKPPDEDKGAPKFKKDFKLQGGYQAGLTKQGQKPKIQRSRPYVGELERQKQFLKHLSTQLYYATQEALNKSPIVEVEAMSVGNALFIATNEEVSAKALYEVMIGDLEKALTKTYEKAIGGRQKRLESAKSKKTAEKFQQWYGGYRVIEPTQLSAEKLFTRVYHASKKNVELIDVDQVTPEHFREYKIFVLQGYPSKNWTGRGGDHDDGRHAEMKLLYVVVKNGYQLGAVISGKKRPCFGCFAALSHYAKQHRLVVGTRPGKIWFKTYDQEIGKIQTDWENLLKDNQIHVTSVYFEGQWRNAQQFDSESDSEPEEKSVRVDKQLKVVSQQLSLHQDLDEFAQRLYEFRSVNNYRYSSRQQRILDDVDEVFFADDEGAGSGEDD